MNNQFKDILVMLAKDGGVHKFDDCEIHVTVVEKEEEKKSDFIRVPSEVKFVKYEDGVLGLSHGNNKVLCEGGDKDAQPLLT